LTGKFRRDNSGSVDTKRTALVGAPGEKDYIVMTRSARWPMRLAQHPPPSRWHESEAAQASHQR
jgi:hypothetical protein